MYISSAENIVKEKMPEYAFLVWGPPKQMLMKFERNCAILQPAVFDMKHD